MSLSLTQPSRNYLDTLSTMHRRRHRLLTNVLPSILIGLLLLCGCESSTAHLDVARGDSAFAALDLENALLHYNKALEADAKATGAYLGRGKIYWMTNQHEKALPDFNQALALQPDQPWALYYRGISLMMLRRFDEGVTDLSQIVGSEVFPVEDLARIHRFRGIGYMNLERYDEALQDFSTCIDLQPENAFYYMERAQLHEGLGHTLEARSDYQAYLAITPDTTTLAAKAQQKLDSLMAATPDNAP